MVWNVILLAPKCNSKPLINLLEYECGFEVQQLKWLYNA